MHRHTIAMTDPTALMWPRRIGVAPLSWRRIAAVFAAMGFAVYLLGLLALSQGSVTR